MRAGRVLSRVRQRLLDDSERRPVHQRGRKPALVAIDHEIDRHPRSAHDVDEGGHARQPKVGDTIGRLVGQTEGDVEVVEGVTPHVLERLQKLTGAIDVLIDRGAIVSGAADAIVAIASGSPASIASLRMSVCFGKNPL